MNKIVWGVLGALSFFGVVEAADPVSAEVVNTDIVGGEAATVAVNQVVDKTAEGGVTVVNEQNTGEEVQKGPKPKPRTTRAKKQVDGESVKGTPNKGGSSPKKNQKTSPEKKGTVNEAPSKPVSEVAAAVDAEKQALALTKLQNAKLFLGKAWNGFIALPGVRHVGLGAQKFVALPVVSHAINYTGQSKAWLESQASAHPYVTLMVGGTLVHFGVHVVVGGLAMTGVLQVVPATWIAGVSGAFAALPGQLAFVKFW